MTPNPRANPRLPRPEKQIEECRDLLQVLGRLKIARELFHKASLDVFEIRRGNLAFRLPENCGEGAEQFSIPRAIMAHDQVKFDTELSEKARRQILITCYPTDNLGAGVHGSTPFRPLFSTHTHRRLRARKRSTPKLS